MPTFDPIRDADQTNQRERARTMSRVHQGDVYGTSVRQPPAPVRRVSTLAMILNNDAEKPPLSVHRVSLSLSPTVSTPHSVLSDHDTVHIHTLVYTPSRITPPGSILTPVTSQDLDPFQRPDNPLRRALGIPASPCTQVPNRPPLQPLPASGVATQTRTRTICLRRRR